MCTITQRTEEILQGMWETKTNTTFTCSELCLKMDNPLSKPMKHALSPLCVSWFCDSPLNSYRRHQYIIYLMHLSKTLLSLYFIYSVTRNTFYLKTLQLNSDAVCVQTYAQQKIPEDDSICEEHQGRGGGHGPMLSQKWRWISHSWDGFCTIGKSYLYPKSRGHLSSGVVVPLQSSPFYDVHYFSCTHINKARAAGTESADCVTVWPPGQASFLVPPVLTLACEKLKLFQIFPLNIYPVRAPRGKIPGSGMSLRCNERIWTANNILSW